MISMKKLQLPLIIILLISFAAGFLYYELQYITIHGKVNCKDIRNFNLSYPCIVEKVYVTEGTAVKKGQPLLSLNLDDITLRKKQLEFEIQKTFNEIETENVEIQKLKSNLKYSKQTYQRYQGLLDRDKILLQQGAIAQADVEWYQDTLNYYDKGLNDLSMIIGSKTSKHTTIGILGQKIKLLKDELGKIDSFYRINSIHGREILSPIENGVVSSINVRPGDIAGSDRLAISILDLDSMVIVGNVPEKVIRFIEIGAPAKVIFKTNNWKRQRGRVRWRSEMAFQEQGATFFRVELDMDSKEYLYTNGNVVIKISRKMNLKNLFDL